MTNHCNVVEPNVCKNMYCAILLLQIAALIILLSKHRKIKLTKSWHVVQQSARP